MNVSSRHNRFIYGFLRLYTKLILHLNFQRIIIKGDITDKNKAILVISNHSGWWDGFWIMYMNMKLFRRKFHFMMLEDQLLKNRFFMKTGGYPVRKKSRSILASINHTIELLRDKENIVLVFPQGKIESSHLVDIRFEKGIARIISKTSAQVIFTANFTDYLSARKPTLFIFTMEYQGNGSFTDIETSYRDFYQLSKNELINQSPE